MRCNKKKKKRGLLNDEGKKSWGRGGGGVMKMDVPQGWGAYSANSPSFFCLASSSNQTYVCVGGFFFNILLVLLTTPYCVLLRVVVLNILDFCSTNYCFL